MRIGLVLGAGGAVGVAYHGAVLAALEEMTGWDPRTADILIGTSAGSLSAATLRAGFSASDLASISEDLPLTPEGAALAALGRPHRPRPVWSDALSLRPVSDIGGLWQAASRPWAATARGVAMAALPSGCVPTSAISEGIDAVFAGRWPQDPLWICSWDVRAGKRVVFGRPGAPPISVGSAVAASCAIPMYFRPVVVDGRRYVDGGVHSMVNLDLAATAGLDLVVVVSPMSAASVRPTPSPFYLVRQRMRVRLHAEIQALRDTGVQVAAIEPARSVLAAMGANPMDAAHRGDVSRSTRASMRRWLRDGTSGRRLAEVLRRAAAEGETLARRPSA